MTMDEVKTGDRVRLTASNKIGTVDKLLPEYNEVQVKFTRRGFGRWINVANLEPVLSADQQNSVER